MPTKARVKLPRYITIAGKRWKIRRWLAGSTDECGLCDWDSLIIYIAPHLEGEELIDTIIHELNHAVTGKYRESKTLEIGTVTARFLRRAKLTRG